MNCGEHVQTWMEAWGRTFKNIRHFKLVLGDKTCSSPLLVYLYVTVNLKLFLVSSPMTV